jgi:phosphoglycerol transferase MdoB-like AlkP superfamily enzyme
MNANNIFDKAGASIDLWNQKVSYQTNGVITSFLLNTKYLKVEIPQNYSIEKVNDVISKVNSVGTEKSIDNNVDSSRPNIITIMNESFSDLNMIGNFKTNQDFMPFIHSLNKNAIKGNLFVSTFGGGTSTTEWEFLTGNSMAFIPPGGLPYQQYIHGSSNSLVRNLKALNYNTIAIHPYPGSGWSRDKAYPLLGFDKFITIEDFQNPEVVRNCFASDSEDYKKIIKTYEEKQKDDKLFIFNTTIQNHGGYETDNSIFGDSVYLIDQNYSDVNEYLSLIKKSDEAFEELIKYFSNQKEPTIIVLFGDHLPALDVGFYEQLYQKPIDSLTLKEIQKKYTVPFVIWANYDIKEQYIDKISTNYLSSLLLDVANLPSTGYNKFLGSAYKEMPVININGSINAQGYYYSFDKSDNKDLINDYKILQYNNMFDTKNTVNPFFQKIN